MSMLVFGLSRLDAPFKGGVLVPKPQVLVPVVTSVTGALSLPFTLPPGLPEGTTLYFQVWISDPAASAGLAASNALEGTTPL